MIALLKKDWRVYRMATIGSLLIVLTIYVIAGLTLLGNDRPIRSTDVVETFFGAGTIGLFVSAILTGMYGSGAFTLERRDRSADFLAMMPTTRGRIIASKAFVAIGCSLVIWLINLCELWLVIPWELTKSVGNPHEFLMAVTIVAGSSVMFFGIAWLLSTFLNSAAISFGIAITIVLGSLTLIETWRHRHVFNDATAEHIDCVLTFSVGIVCFIAGVIYYLRRVEP